MLEVLHAVSMIPGVIIAWQHAHYNNDFYKLCSSYAYILTCVFSMNYHIFRHVNPDLNEYWTTHQRALYIDLFCQNVCMFFTSFSTIAGFTGALFSLVGCLADYAMVYYGKNEHMIFRHLRFSFLIVWMSADNPPALIWFITAFAFYVIAKYVPKLYILHMPFHLCLGFAIHEIWKQDDKHIFPFTIPGSYAFPLISGLFFLCSKAAAYSYANKKAIEHLYEFWIGLAYTIMNVYVFLKHFDHRQLFKRYYNDASDYALPFHQVRMEIAFYTSFTIIEALNRDYDLLIHHILAAGYIMFAHLSGYHHFIMVTLFLFTLSNAPLALSKYARAANHETLASYSFGLFALLFFVCRIIGVLVLIKFTLIDGIQYETLMNVFIGNLFIGLLYVMQLMWFKKIIKILIKVCSKKIE